MTDHRTEDERLTGPKLIELMTSRFTSLNPIPVERATIKRQEWETLLKEIRDTGELGFHGGRNHGKRCFSCEMADAVKDALEKLHG